MTFLFILIKKHGELGEVARLLKGMGISGKAGNVALTIMTAYI